MNKRNFLSLTLILAATATVTFFKVPLASSQGLTITAAEVSGDLPANDPGSDLWQKTTAVEVPLSAQNVTRPMILDTKVKSVTVRALHNDKQIGLLIEWADETKDDAVNRVQDFRDAVAVQFPLVENQPFFCMGQQGGNVNIWHWKADWQADIAARQDIVASYPNMYVDQYPFTSAGDPIVAGPADYTDKNYLPALASGNLFASEARTTPVEDLIAGGFGSLTAQPAEGQNVAGYGAWVEGTWRVIFIRDLASPEADDVSFAPGKVYSIAFAAWDGANGERNGQKSTSQWVSLNVESAVSAGPAASTPTQRNLTQDYIWALVLVVTPMAAVTLLIVGIAAVVFLASKMK